MENSVIDYTLDCVFRGSDAENASFLHNSTSWQIILNYFGNSV